MGLRSLNPEVDMIVEVNLYELEMVEDSTHSNMSTKPSIVDLEQAAIMQLARIPRLHLHTRSMNSVQQI